MKKPPSEHTRLARAFNVPPTKRGFAASMTGGFTLIGVLGGPFAFIPAAAFAGGIALFEVTDRRAIKQGLKELESWGFPIEGYRSWLLADEPAFDVDLRREIELQMLVTSAAAIDASIQVRRTHERGFRIVTRRIALPGAKEGALPVYLGDRRMLRDLHERILSPLHADVGIVAMRMGDRATLAEVTPGPTTDDDGAPAVHGMGAFRDQAFAAPPALQSLVHNRDASVALTHDATKLPHRSLRVLSAAGRSPAGVGTVLAITLGGMFTGVQLGPIGAGIGATGGLIGGIAAAIATNRKNAKAIANLVGWHGFAIEGYDDWLISGRPLFDIETKSPLEREWLLERMQRIVAFSTERNESVRWVEDVTWLDEQRVRIETRPTLIVPSGSGSTKIRPFYGGSHILFQMFVAEVLVPLQATIGVAAVRMGGYVDRRV